MDAASTEPDPRLTDLACGAVEWRYAAQVQSVASADALAWARRIFEDARLPMRVFLVVGWTALLLEGRPASDEAHVLGWPLTQATPRMAVLQRRSRLGIRATLLFVVEPDTVTFSSAMVFTNRLGRVVWAIVAPVHRWAVRVVLSHAAAEAR